MLVERQRLGAPVAVALSIAFSVWGGSELPSHHYKEAIPLLVGAVGFGLLALIWALMQPSEDEIAKERRRLERKVASIQGRLR